MRITLDPSSPEPLSEQLSAAIADRIRRGSLAPGARLPTVRALAEDLGLAANTVASAQQIYGAATANTVRAAFQARGILPL